MNAIKKILGVVWIIIGIYAVYYLIVNPAVIYTVVLCPMIAGALGFFGLYCLQGEYND
jgi:hypothetical protein